MANKGEEKKRLFSDVWNKIQDATSQEEIEYLANYIDDLECARMLSKSMVDQLNEDLEDKRMAIEKGGLTND